MYITDIFYFLWQNWIRCIWAPRALHLRYCPRPLILIKCAAVKKQPWIKFAYKCASGILLIPDIRSPTVVSLRMRGGKRELVKIWSEKQLPEVGPRAAPPRVGLSFNLVHLTSLGWLASERQSGLAGPRTAPLRHLSYAAALLQECKPWNRRGCL